MYARHFAALAGCFVVLGATAVRAQLTPQPPSTEQFVVELQSGEARVWEHRLGPTAAVHVTSVEAPALGFESYLTFEIVVSADGHVESAKLVGDEKRHLDEGLAIEMARRFKPWTQDGKNIRVRVSDEVALLPPERWALVPRSFPEPWNLKHVKIELSRGVCYGRCPAYSVTIRGDGSVHFSGQRFVQVLGEHDSRITPDAVRQLVHQFEAAKFFAADDKYIAEVTD